MQDDQEIVALICCKDQAGLEAIIRRYGSKVRGLCELIVVDPLDADSVMSDVFLEFWDRPERYRCERGSLQTYLMTLARSRSIDRVRSKAAQNRRVQPNVGDLQMEQSHDQEQPDSALQESERKEKIEWALARLPDCQKDSLRLAFFQGLTHREVAQRVDMPLGTVKSNIRNGLLRLRSLLSTEFVEGGAS